MDKLVINGGKHIWGQVEISGAKNAAVAILPVAIIASKGKCIIENIPDIEDVNCIERILEGLGCKIKRDKNSVSIDSTNIKSIDANSEDVRAMRASYYLIGALLARFKKANVDLPGGCPIGERPIDQHIKGFEALGATVIIENGAAKVQADKLIGTIYRN
jgi:UDP-N-acetylglucosamine 1-carboxyvinyltransferase